MANITANELKTKGVANIERILQTEPEVIISVRGKPKYVVVEIEQYEALRERELEAAWFQVKEDVGEGLYRIESADEHMDRIKADLANEL